MRRLAPRWEIWLVAAACVVPRLAVLLHERGAIVGSFTEKSDFFAETFVRSGTYGFIPDVPSAYTQPLYGFFLVPIYWVFGRSWAAIGLAQIAVALAVALLVHWTARRWISPRAGVLAALVATLNPYLVWHDVHVNREILDQLLAVAMIALALLAWEQRRIRVAAALGAVAGLAVLGNTRLVALPLVLVAFLAPAFRGRTLVAGVALVAAAVVVAAPWVVRNRVQVGCYALTTDGRALWKANNERTYETLKAGKWIDNVPPVVADPPTPDDAGKAYRQIGYVLRVDECAQMRHYQHLVWVFWKEHPGEKGKLAVQATRMLWDPRSIRTEDRPGRGTFLDHARSWAEPIYAIPLFALALVGALVVPRVVAALAVLMLGYQTIMAMVFAGTTRYRAPWDFVLALLAGGALVWIAERYRRPVAAAPSPNRLPSQSR
jgi:4-amino-4-deoxy-L-arabinose transferase-like glycosyltransferase